MVDVAGAEGRNIPSVSIWHGTADTRVVPRNREELVEQWTAVHGISTTPGRNERYGPILWELFVDGNAPARAAHRRRGGPFDYTKDLSNDGPRVWDANSDFWAMLLLSCTTAITGGMHGKEDQV